MFSEGYTAAAVSKFEEVNKIGINIYYIGPDGPEQTEIKYVSIYSAIENFSPMINLGYLESTEPVEGGVKFISHFIIIQKLNLIITKAYETNPHSILICPLCFTYILDKKYLPKHYKQYHSGDSKKPEIILPKPYKAFIKFDLNNVNHFKKTEVYPFVCYADFEANNEKIKIAVNNKEQEAIRQYPNSYAIYCPDLLKLSNKHDRVSTEVAYKYYIHEDLEKLMKKFVEDLYYLHNMQCNKLQGHPKMKPLTPEQQKKHEEAPKCEKCGKEFGSKVPSKKDPNKFNTVIKVKHHDHKTGNFVGTWCQSCNWNEAQRSFKTTIIIHNCRGYDSHFIIRYAIKVINEKLNSNSIEKSIPQFSVAKSKEKFSCIEYGPFRFIDFIFTYLFLRKSSRIHEENRINLY
jgi:ribosomal protein L34E